MNRTKSRMLEVGNMPDWSYQTLFRPVLFRLPAPLSRELTFTAIGTLAKLPIGPTVIRIMGHMDPPKQLEKNVLGLSFPSPLGLAAGLDIHQKGLKALSQFGFGFLEVGPVTLNPISTSQNVERRADQQSIWYSDVRANDGLDAVSQRLEKLSPLSLPVGIRLGHAVSVGWKDAAEEVTCLIENLKPYADFFILDTTYSDRWTTDEWLKYIRTVRNKAKFLAIELPLLLYLLPDNKEGYPNGPLINILLEQAIAEGVEGIVIGDAVQEKDGGYLVGPQNKTYSLELIRYIRNGWGEDLPIIASGGIHEPQDALQLLNEGVDLLQVHSGLVYSGPGLPKRINEAVVYEQLNIEESSRLDVANSKKHVESKSSPILSKHPFADFWKGWGWIVFLGLGMIVGGVLAWIVAATVVVLPYDEAFVGIDRADLSEINERLLHFMEHDRITLAGTMISIGIMYWQLAFFGLRRGLHWARQTVLVSAAIGFSSFFLYLGFGYFDPLHALVSSLLLPFFLIGIWGCRKYKPNDRPANLHNDNGWYVGLWGQLLFVILGFSLTIGGIIISIIGMNQVFVPEDLIYLQTTAKELRQANPYLISLIAHDRAGFGGALFSLGIAILLLSLWGIRQGEQWVWWTLLGSGLPGFVAGFGVHYRIEYIDGWHLSPAVFVLLLYVVGLVMLYPYLCMKVRSKV
jgi:dihydroorotate dehydrogenase